MGQTAWIVLTVNLGTLVVVAFLAGSVRRSERTVTLVRDELADVRTRLDRSVQGLEASHSGAVDDGACPHCGHTEEPVEPGLPAPYVVGSPAGAGGPDSARLVTRVTLGEPLIKVAAFSFGVRRALTEENRALIAYRVRRELKRRRGMRRADTRRAA
jgi:hypothetical protein